MDLSTLLNYYPCSDGFYDETIICKSKNLINIFFSVLESLYQNHTVWSQIIIHFAILTLVTLEIKFCNM